jgi:hypothetical protein
MKQLKLLLLFACTLSVWQMKGQTGANCSNAIPINQPFSQTYPSGVSERWYRFNTTKTAVQYEVSQKSNQINVSKIEFYSGTCSTLTLIGKDSLSSPTDSIKSITETNLTVGTDYYIRVVFIDATQKYDYLLNLLAPESQFCIQNLTTGVTCCFDEDGPNPGDCGSLNACVGDVISIFDQDPSYPYPITITDASNPLSVISATIPVNGNYLYTCTTAGSFIIKDMAPITNSSQILNVFGSVTPIVSPANSSVFCQDECVPILVLNPVGSYTNAVIIPPFSAVPCYPSTNSFLFPLGLNTFEVDLNSGLTCSTSIVVNITIVPKTFTITSNPVPCSLTQNISITTSCASIFNAYDWYTLSSTGVIDGTYTSPTPNFPITFASTGTYTVYVIDNSTSTTNSIVVNVTAPSTPTITISPSPQALCVGSCATYTASGALTYTWSTGATTATVTLCPTVTTTYSVQGTDACGNTAVKYITIGVTPLQGPIPAFAVPNPICPGAVSHLLTNGATSYTWMPGNFNGNNYPVFPLVTTSYTVFGTNGCGTSSAVATVSVLSNAPPSVTITSSNYYPCEGSVITLTANVSPAGTYTYNWQAPINQSTQVVTFTPTNNAVYSCYVTNQCGSTQLAQACISLVSKKCCVASETMSFVTIPTGAYFSNLNSVSYNVYGTITISGNVSWSNSDFKMQQGAKIVVLPNASLTLNKCNLYSCKDIWEGITVLSNGTISGVLNVKGGTVIEDAYKAIAYDGLNTPYPANISVTGSDLNKNYIGVSLKNSTPTTANVTLNNFTGSQYRTAASLTSPGTSLKCSNGFYVPSVKPYGYKGFDANNQTQTYVIGLNTGAPNNFDRLDFGYYGFNSNINIENCTFNNIVGSNGAGSPPPYGVAVYSESSPSVTNSFVRVESTRHTQVWRGIELKNIKDILVGNNDISNTTTSPAGCGSGCIGSIGIMVTNLRNTGYVWSNRITNSYNGIVTLFNQVVASPTFSYGVSTNTITTTGTGYCVTAIVLQDAVNNFGVAGANISIANNPISNVQNGILSNNIKSGLRISNNPIGVQFATTGLRYGIRLNGTLKAFVDNNTISSTGATNANLRGIYMQLSPNCKVQCNTISNVGQCVVYEGNNSSLINGFANNAMSNAKDGLVLKSNGVIGQQGFILIGTNIVSGNTWSVPTGSWGNSKTFTDLSGGAINSSAQNSKLYVSNNPTENPYAIGGVLYNKTTNTYGIHNYFPTGTNKTLIVGNGASLSCPTALPYAQRVMPFQPLATIGQLIVQDQSLTDLINTSINYGINNIPTQFLQRQYVYNAIKQAQVVTTNSTLTTFFNSNANTGLGQFAGVDSLIIKQQHAQASALNATASTGTPLEQNHQQVNTQLLNKLLNATYNYSASDMSTLYGIAGKCPLSDGNAVYQARALLCYIEDRVIEFTDSCDAGDTKGARIGHSDDNGNSYVEEMADNFILFPNPNNGTMQLLYSLHQAKTATLTVYDITGKQVYAKDLDTNTSLVDVSINNLSQGVYYYKIIDASSKVLKSDKLIIIK